MICQRKQILLEIDEWTCHIDYFSAPLTGATAAGVPGEVKGFYEAWKKYGKLPWKNLVQPSIDMARNGFPFGYSAEYAAKRSSVFKYIKADPGLRFVKKPV